MTNATTPTNINEVEHLYQDYEGDYGNGCFVHRILKKTAKRVYVAKLPTSSKHQDGETIALDRHQLETEGCATNKRCWVYFYTTPWEARHKPAVPQYLSIFGLERGATAETIKAAYRRLAKEHHPDHGGNVDEFKRLQEAYEMAMSSVA